MTASQLEHCRILAHRSSLVIVSGTTKHESASPYTALPLGLSCSHLNPGSTSQTLDPACSGCPPGPQPSPSSSTQTPETLRMLWQPGTAMISEASASG